MDNINNFNPNNKDAINYNTDTIKNNPNDKQNLTEKVNSNTSQNIEYTSTYNEYPITESATTESATTESTITESTITESTITESTITESTNSESEISEYNNTGTGSTITVTDSKSIYNYTEYEKQLKHTTLSTHSTEDSTENNIAIENNNYTESKNEDLIGKRAEYFINESTDYQKDLYTTNEFELDIERFKTDYLYQEYIQQYYPEYYDDSYFPKSNDKYSNYDSFVKNNDYNTSEYVSNNLILKVNNENTQNENSDYSDEGEYGENVDDKYKYQKEINSVACYVNLDKQIPEKKIIFREKLNSIIEKTLKKILSNNNEYKKKKIEQQLTIIMQSAANQIFITPSNWNKINANNIKSFAEISIGENSNSADSFVNSDNHMIDTPENNKSKSITNNKLHNNSIIENNYVNQSSVSNNKPNVSMQARPSSSVSYANTSASKLITSYKNNIMSKIKDNINTINTNPFIIRPRQISKEIQSKKKNYSLQNNNISIDKINILKNIEYFKYTYDHQTAKMKGPDNNDTNRFYTSSDVKKQLNETMKKNILRKFNNVEKKNSPAIDEKDKSQTPGKQDKKEYFTINKKSQTGDMSVNKQIEDNHTNNCSKKPNILFVKNSYKKDINQIFLEKNNAFPKNILMNEDTLYKSDEYLKYQNWIPSNKQYANHNHTNKSIKNTNKISKHDNNIYHQNNPHNYSVTKTNIVNYTNVKENLKNKLIPMKNKNELKNTNL